MRSHHRLHLTPLAAAAIAASLGIAGCGSSGEPAAQPTTSTADGQADTTTTHASEPSPSTTTATAEVEGETLEWEDARVFIEYNSDAGDYGFHAEFGSDPWTTATITGPDDEELLDLTTAGTLAEHGMSGVFFESAEFPPEELALAEFLTRFPEGDYTFTGETLDEEALAGTSTFTHLIPDPPTILTPEVGAEVDPADLTVSWEPVTSPTGVEIEVYTLQLFPVDPPEGQDPILLDIDYTFEVPAHITAIRLLPELFQAGETYEYELMAVDAAGNQAYSLGEFTIQE